MSPLFRSIALLSLSVTLAGCPFDGNKNFEPTVDPLTTGLYEFQSAGVVREYFLQLPSDYDGDAALVESALGDDDRKPLLIAFHGYTGSLNNWVGEGRSYDLIDEVGDGAIMVFPNALPNSQGDRAWNTDTDLQFFLDLIAELNERGLQYNPNKKYITGHSNGAGFTHEVACNFGDIVRAAAPVAGNLTSTDCIGSAAIMITQGNNDPLVDVALVRTVAERYWVLYNGWDESQSTVASNPACIDYSFPGEPNSDYPVFWCEHSQGHSWPDYASATIWQFFSNLNEVEPTTEFPDGGGSERATPQSDTTLTFRLKLPADINRPLIGAATLWPVSQIEDPACAAPTMFLNSGFSLDGVVAAGQISEPITIPINLVLIELVYPVPSDWALSITVYVEGGSRPIPAPGVDHDAYIPVTIVGKNTPIIIDEPIEVTPADNPCDF